MKNIVSIVAVLAVVTTPAFAAPKKNTTVKKTTTTETTTTTTTTTSPASAAVTDTSVPSHRVTKKYGPGWGVDAGLGSAGKKFTFGVGLKYEIPVSLEHNSFKVGGRTGFFFGPADPSTWFVPLAVTGTYELKQEGAIKPYIGLDLGLAVYHTSGTNVDIAGIGTQTIGGDTGIKFLGLFRPGAHFGERYYAEIPVGIIGSDFAILPSVGMHF